MKKILITIGLTTILLIQMTSVALAKECVTSLQCDKGEICAKNVCTDLIPRAGEDLSTNKKYPETGKLVDLPEVTVEDVIATTIMTILKWSLSLAIVALIVTGTYYLISQGNEEELSKAKNILIYLIVGMLIIAAAYAIVSGVAQINPFEAS